MLYTFDQGFDQEKQVSELSRRNEEKNHWNDNSSPVFMKSFWNFVLCMQFPFEN